MKSSRSQGTSPLALAGTPSRAQPGLGAHGATHFIHPATCLPSAVPATSALGQRTALSWRPDCRAGTTRQRTSGWGSSALTTRQPCVSIAPSCFLLGAGSGFALELKVLFEVTDMNFCWACPKSAWKTCGQLPWTGPRPLPAALPEFLGAAAVGDWGAKQQGPVTVHVTRQDSTGEATCGLPAFHPLSPTSCCLSHQLPLAGQWMAGSCPGRGPQAHGGVWGTHTSLAGRGRGGQACRRPEPSSISSVSVLRTALQVTEASDGLGPEGETLS